MITQSILAAMMWLVEVLFNFIQLPALPVSILSSITNITQFMSIPIGIVQNYVGAWFLNLLLGLIIGLVLFFPVFKIIEYIYHKIKG